MITWLIIIAVCVLAIIVILSQTQEKFTPEFDASKGATGFLEYMDMGDHRTLVYLQKGNSGETVLLLHNNPMSLSIWRPLFEVIQNIGLTGKATPNLVAYDIRGHGSAWVPAEPRFADSNVSNYEWPLDLFVNDCKNIYDKVIGTGKITICGFGFGGLIAQKFSLSHPELITRMVLLQTSIKPMPGLRDQIDYLSGPDGWLARNPYVTYLTPEESFVQKLLCEWFYLPPEMKCPADKLIDDDDLIQKYQGPEYNLAAMLMRTGSSSTTLQVIKLESDTDLSPMWETAKNLPFSIHILAATDDPLAPPNKMTDTYTTIYNNNRQVTVAMDIVNGRHGFTIARPDYIAGIICSECRSVR